MATGFLFNCESALTTGHTTRQQVHIELYAHEDCVLRARSCDPNQRCQSYLRSVGDNGNKFFAPLVAIVGSGVAGEQAGKYSDCKPRYTLANIGDSRIGA